MEILGQAAPCKSTGEAMAMMEELASKLPSGMDMTDRCPTVSGCPATVPLPVCYLADRRLPVFGGIVLRAGLSVLRNAGCSA